MKAPSSKLQAPGKLQDPRSKSQTDQFGAWRLGIWSLFVVWILVFGAWSFRLPAQTAAPDTAVTLPVTLTVTFPAPLQTNIFVTNVFVTNVSETTNYFVTVTNVYVTNITNVVSTRLVVDMTNNVIAWPGPGRDLYREITIPTVFTMGAVPPGAAFVLQLRNLAKFPITWPASLQVIGVLPTNEVRSAVVFVETHGEIWVSR